VGLSVLKYFEWFKPGILSRISPAQKLKP